jgi:phosphomannomutase
MSLHDPVMPMNIESGEAGGVQRILDQLDPFFSRYGELKI